MKPSLEAYNLLHEGSLVLSRIETNGVRVNKDYLDSTLISIDKNITDLEAQMREDKQLFPVWKKMKFQNGMNLGSRKQLASVLQKMGYQLPRTEKEIEIDREWGSRVDKTVLEKIGADVQFLSHFQEVERLKKTKSTYLMGIKREMVEHHKGQWYVHPSYNLNTVATYRSSADSPNFQNVPVRNPDLSKMVRQCYIPPDGWYFVEIDFGQQEVRCAYCYHKDPTMGKYLSDPKSDMHRDWASYVYKLKPDQISKNSRYAAKNMWVFPQFYGSVYFQCAPALWEAMDNLPGMAVMEDGDDPKNPSGMKLKKWLKSKGINSLGECHPDIVRRDGTKKGTFVHHLKELQRSMWEDMFPVYNQWKWDAWDDYQKKGWCEFLTGFVMSGSHARNDVINYRVQGPAFHCLLKCLIKIQSWLKKYRMRSLMVGEIHDSVQAVCPPNELQDFLSYCQWCMTVWLPREWKWIICNLEVEMEVSPLGESWYRKQVWTQQNGTWKEKPK